MDEGTKPPPPAGGPSFEQWLKETKANKLHTMLEARKYREEVKGDCVYCGRDFNPLITEMVCTCHTGELHVVPTGIISRARVYSCCGVTAQSYYRCYWGIHETREQIARRRKQVIEKLCYDKCTYLSRLPIEIVSLIAQHPAKSSAPIRYGVDNKYVFICVMINL